MESDVRSAYVKFDEAAQRKQEYHSEVCSSALSFVTFITQRPPLEEWKNFILFCILRVCFLLYALFFLVFGIIECLIHFTDYFWLLHITMLIKLVVVRVALSSIKERLEWQSSPAFLQLMDESIPFAKKYFVTTSICNVCAMAFYYGVWSDELLYNVFNVALVSVFVLGTLAYTMFSTCILMISITDARRSHQCEYTVMTSCA